MIRKSITSITSIKRCFFTVSLIFLATTGAAFGSLMGTSMAINRDLPTTFNVIQAEIDHCRAQNSETMTASNVEISKNTQPQGSAYEAPT